MNHYEKNLPENAHYTASALVLNTQMDKMLLTHHAKLDMWLQLGGHIEDDEKDDFLKAAIREAIEESGLESVIALSTDRIDFDIHEIPAHKENPPHLHYDVRYLLRAQKSNDLAINARESKSLEWIDFNPLVLNHYSQEESLHRLVRNAIRFFFQDMKKAPKAQDSHWIALEGGEACGKSTQLGLLKDHFIELGYQVHDFREPGSTFFGENLRKIIKESPTELHPLSVAYLMCSARAQLYDEKILKVLQKPKQIVLLDRSIFSTLAYQGLADPKALGLVAIANMHKFYPLHFMPDITIYLDLPFEASGLRMEKRQKELGETKDFFEKKPSVYHQKIYDSYKILLKIFPEYLQSISAEDNKGVVFQQIITLCKKTLNMN